MAQDGSRTNLSTLLDNLKPNESGYAAQAPPDWMQGRAIYGGLSTALCLAGALKSDDGLPPLRSAQISFLGPAGEDVDIATRMLRRGRSSAFVQSDLTCGSAITARALFCFGAARQSAYSRVDLSMPAVSEPAACPDYFRFGGPEFSVQFDARHAAGHLPLAAATDADSCAWVRHQDAASRETIVGLAALADALPPAALTMFHELAPISTMTWQFDMLTSEPRTTDGWWLCRSTADAVGEGYSAQRMAIWNRDGEPAVTGRQTIAVFA